MHKFVWHSGQWYFVLRRRILPCASIVFQQKLQPSAGPGRSVGQWLERVVVSKDKSLRVDALTGEIKSSLVTWPWGRSGSMHTSGDEIDRWSSSDLTRIDGSGRWCCDCFWCSGCCCTFWPMCCCIVWSPDMSGMMTTVGFWCLSEVNMSISVIVYCEMGIVLLRTGGLWCCSWSSCPLAAISWAAWVVTVLMFACDEGCVG